MQATMRVRHTGCIFTRSGPGVDVGHSDGKWLMSLMLLSNLEGRRSCRHPCRGLLWAMSHLRDNLKS